MRRRLGVIGAGVVGLSSAIELAKDYDVEVVTDRPLLQTTSAIATAIWHVYLLDPNDTHVIEWARISLRRYLAIMSECSDAGLSLSRGIELFRRSTPVVPTWKDIPPVFRMLTGEELRKYPGVRWGYEIAAPLADMRVYLPWLLRAAMNAGVKVVHGHVTELRSFGGGYDLVVNCAGFGSRELVGDRSLRPVRGQYLLVNRSWYDGDIYIGDDENPGGMTYAIPRLQDVCVGGTEEYDVERLAFELEDRVLLQRVDSLIGRRENEAVVLERVVGLRPFRAAGVRLELERLAGQAVIHNYGHGGSGFSVAWGCAAGVAELARSLFS